MILYKYIFSKAYYFCIWAFKEKEFPWAWAAITTSMVIVMTIITVLQAVEVYAFPQRVETYSSYHKYFSLGMALLALWYVHRGDRYLGILKTVENLTPRERSIVRYGALLYLLILMVAYFWLTEIIRDAN
jgi:cytochrome bd-type quinol oxidase subunit 2